MAPLHVEADDCASGYLETVRTVLGSGTRIRGGLSMSVRSGQDYVEVMPFTLTIGNARTRMMDVPGGTFDLAVATARFVWLLAASDRLDAIAFYTAGVSRFTDDGETVPGSSFGKRIFDSKGLNQLQAAIARLRDDPQSRRAGVAVFQPEDAVRESHDIPCLVGLFFHVRDGKLAGTVMMRANNAYALLPFNLFELSLVVELVAADLGLSLGPLTYSVVSMHLYEPELSRAQSLAQMGPLPSQPVMPVMPGHHVRHSAQQLVLAEQRLRTDAVQVLDSEGDHWLREGGRLPEYWRNFYYTLLHFVALRNGANRLAEQVRELAEEPWRRHLLSPAPVEIGR